MSSVKRDPPSGSCRKLFPSVFLSKHGSARLFAGGRQCFFGHMTHTCCPISIKNIFFCPNCLTNEALPRAPTGDTEGVNAENMRNKKKAFAAMALVALATPQATAIANSDSVNQGSNPGPSARESASNRCVFVVSSLAGIVLKLPRVSYPAKASAATRDAKCLGAGRERPQGLSRPFSSRRMWSVSAGF